MKFTPIDLQTWPRGQMFYYFSKMAPTGYSLTVNIDITELRQTLKKSRLKVFSGVFVACYKKFELSNRI